MLLLSLFEKWPRIGPGRGSVSLPNIYTRLKSPIFAHQGFCVYEALAHPDMIMCILTARRPVYNESFHC